MRPMTLATLFAATTVLFTAMPIRAAITPEQACLKNRYIAAAKYDACEQKYVGQSYGAANLVGFVQDKFSKCRVKYIATWAKLQAKAAGSGAFCDNPRFDTTTTPGTVTDRLTGLVWEQKTDDMTVHDKDNSYTWSASAANNPDGTAFTSFLTTLNSGVCFAGKCDWRLPTRLEAETILAGGFPCSMSPCIDQTTFGPTVGPGIYWTSTTDASSSDRAWAVAVSDGSVIFDDKVFADPARAVRGGL